MILYTTNISDELGSRVFTLLNEGHQDQAHTMVNEELSDAKEALHINDEVSVMRLIDSLELKGDFLRLIGFLEESRLCYMEAIKNLRKFTSRTRMLARLNADVGVLYDLVGNYNEARQFYERAISLYERSKRKDNLEIADISNNLAFIYSASGDFNHAETLFLRALGIYRDELGEKDEKTATVLNNLGALYLYSDLGQQAYEMNRMALESRLGVFGENHVDTAQSYSNLAVSEFRIGKARSANENFLKGVRIYENQSNEVSKGSGDYEIVIENYADYLRATGRDNQAKGVLKRAHDRLSNDSKDESELKFSFAC